MTPDNLPPEIGLPLAVLLWTIVIVTYLKERRRG